MKRTIAIGLVVAAGCASADVYTDPTGNTDVDDFFLGQGFTHLDIAQVEMTSDATHLNIAVTLNGDIAATDWGKYLVFIDTDNGATGNAGNAWGRNVDANNNNNFFMGTWVDGGGGAEVHAADGGGGWVRTDATWDGSTRVSVDLSDAASGVTNITVELAALGGLSVGDTINFDIVATAGGVSDPGVDHLSLDTPATNDWGVGSVAGTYKRYTIVPAPGALALLGMGLVARRRR